ncbi:MAG TPA: HD-GYP domain-containing protein [Candidatus Dormibacteraeota bacterium]|nr:HD-GYP domain-containing protein [Candidatus Dormibacteraeota bacterium]
MAVGLAAFGVFAATSNRLPGARPDWWLLAALAAAGILALEFPLHVNISEKVSVATAVFFAAVLLLPVWEAAALIGLLQACDLGIAAVRKVRATKERPPMRAVAINIVFNGGQAYLSAVAAGILLGAGGVSARAGLDEPRDALVLVAAAAVMYASNLLLVACAIGLATSRNPLPLFLNTQRVVYVQFATLYVIGAIAAFAAVRYSWLPLLAIVPAVLVYHWLRQRVEMRREAMRAMERMADEVDRRDPYTFHHSQRVAIYTHAIARKLGFSAADVELVEVAAKVHDIGKIRIPDAILLKPAALTSDERRVMETHPRLGFDILRPISEYAKVLDLVLTHHERYDGKGYPNGTIGRRLMLIAQVIPVADSLDAMTSARAYRGARSWDSALEELRRGSGTQWNPQVVEAAVAALSQTQRPEPQRMRTAAAGV